MNENSDQTKIYAAQDTKQLKELAIHSPMIEEKIQALKAARQYYTNGLMENNWQKTK